MNTPTTIEALEEIKNYAGACAEAQCDQPYFDMFLFIEGMAHRAWLKEKAKDLSWQPIETAPKDGTIFIAYRPNFKESIVSEVSEDYWFEADDFIPAGWANSSEISPPTHWMPLPQPPKELKS